MRDKFSTVGNWLISPWWQPLERSLKSSAPPEEKKQRFERKFFITDHSLSSVDAIIRRHPALFRDLYTPRWVNSLYFDTWSHQALSDNIEGALSRRKIRIRWYGASTGLIKKPILEYKNRFGLVGHKERYRLHALELDATTSQLMLRQWLQQNDLPPLVRKACARIRPMFVCRYQRRYYLSADQRFRLTLDRRLTYYPFQSQYFQSHISYPVARTLIMEIKYAHALDDAIHTVTAQFPFRVTKSSKFVEGMHRVIRTR
ncbi:polyphosphate polymerase domain-containing protein [Magnetococcales bacterium HHB-1]